MLTIQLLESTDVVEPNDWCRPLSIVSMSGGHSDSYSFTNQYTGAPENNVKWVQVKYILGKPWHGCTVAKIDKELGKFIHYEFVRGDIPKKHQVSYNRKWTDHSKVFRKEEEYDDDIPF